MQRSPTFYTTTIKQTTITTNSKQPTPWPRTSNPKIDSTSTSVPAPAPEVEEATTTDTARKRTADEEAEETAAKRTRIVEETETAATAGIDTSTDTTTTTTTGNDTDTATEQNSSGPPLDLAEVFGFKQGDSLEVQWDVEMEGEKSTKWWGATLDPFDGRTEDGVAVRVLHYDAFQTLALKNATTMSFSWEKTYWSAPILNRNYCYYNHPQ
jgi:hypothetical protein